eukprot:Seg732.11 transcript_id=Seg732.11/GoldUCD/mRNA.D3Y31 product="hypothetical protein" protein_id=Seg732.11/GoldUCD/D3Y31
MLPGEIASPLPICAVIIDMSNKRKTWELYEKKCSAKRRGEPAVKKKSSAPSSIMVQRMSADANRLKKFEPLDTRDFIDFSDYEEISIDNIKLACEQFYEIPKGSCDVLLGDRGPSCYLTEQILGKKVYFIRFLDPTKRAKNSKGTQSQLETGRKKKIMEDNDESNVGVSSFRERHQQSTMFSDTTFPKVPQTAFPKSVSITDLLQARKLFEAPDISTVKMVLESYNVYDKVWETVSTVEFLKENKHFSEGGFRKAYLATSKHPGFPKKWVIKESKEEKVALLEMTVKLSNAQHTRKQVQMHSVARNICQKFAREVPFIFGTCFNYKKVYFSMMNGTPVTVEEFIPGDFEKYSNNTGLMAAIKSDEHK